MSVIVLLADGVRVDVLSSAIDSGALPALARLREEGGGMHTITSVFPSVTGPAYTPFLLGRYPGPVGIPGIRWFDRARRRCRGPGHSRSYVGANVRSIDGDLDAAAPTLFELVPSALGSMNMINRGLARRDRVTDGPLFAARAGWIHFAGDLGGWLDLDRKLAETVARRVRGHRPAFTFAALVGVDKLSHAAGHRAEGVGGALAIVDEMAARIRDDAERSGRWEEMHLWVASDHGHSAVTHHEDLAGLIASRGLRVLAHPWVYTRRTDVAVMVSGNAMAHLYLETARRERPWWPALSARWQTLVNDLLARPSVDLVILPHSSGRCELRTAKRGSATLAWANGRYDYHPCAGDPLGLGEQQGLDDEAAYEVCLESDYPDALVQLAHLAASPRAGDVLLSAARDWDFRARYEPIPHVSSHGALHRDHMVVPLLLNRPPARRPRRTVDVMPSALRALGLPIPSGLDGVSFV
ncbi:MAG: alkaline phosphatase family protein [Gemmatimonadaceae bacterium]